MISYRRLVTQTLHTSENRGRKRKNQNLELLVTMRWQPDISVAPSFDQSDHLVSEEPTVLSVVHQPLKYNPHQRGKL